MLHFDCYDKPFSILPYNACPDACDKQITSGRQGMPCHTKLCCAKSQVLSSAKLLAVKLVMTTAMNRRDNNSHNM